MEIKIIIALILLITFNQFDRVLTTCESSGFEDNWYYKNSSTKEQIVFEHSKKNDWVKFEGYYPRFSVEEIISLFYDADLEDFYNSEEEAMGLKGEPFILEGSVNEDENIINFDLKLDFEFFKNIFNEDFLLKFGEEYKQMINDFEFSEIDTELVYDKKIKKLKWIYKKNGQIFQTWSCSTKKIYK